jgi:hypothetical protein
VSQIFTSGLSDLLLLAVGSLVVFVLREYILKVHNTIIVQVRYIIIETKECARIGYYGILFPHSYSGDGLGTTHLSLNLSTHAEKETRYIQYGSPLLFQ